MQLRDIARSIMQANGNLLQWPDGHPQDTLFEEDIRQNTSFVVEENVHIVATFALVPGIEPTYKYIYEGEWLQPQLPYHTIHRVASTHESRGVFDAIMAYASTVTDNLRIDTHADNTIMQHLILKHGFSFCGIIHLANGDPRYAYQRITTGSVPTR